MTLEEKLKKVNEMQLPEFPDPFDVFRAGLAPKGVAKARQKLFAAKMKVCKMAYAYQKAGYKLLISECNLIIAQERLKKE